MLQEFIIGWLCIIGMMVYTLLVSVRDLGRQSVSVAHATKERFQETVADEPRSYRNER